MFSKNPLKHVFVAAVNYTQAIKILLPQKLASIVNLLTFPI
jgi:hypothetical protein